MEIDEFLNKIENGENVDLEKPKPAMDAIVEKLSAKDADKVAVSDRVIDELKGYESNLRKEKAQNEEIVMKIKQELLVIRNDLTENKLILAKQSLDRLSTLFEMIPDDFLDEKLEIKRDIATMEAAVVGKLLEFYKKDFERKSRIMLLSINQAKKLIKEKKVEQAIAEYRRCQEVYRSLPEGFLLNKVAIYEMIIELYKEVVIATQISSLQNKLEI